LEVIPQLDFSSSKQRREAFILFEHALIRKFAGLWPSPKVVETWVAEH